MPNAVPSSVPSARKTILPAAQESGVKWFIIEHDKPKDAWSIITTSRRNLAAALEQAHK
jgi:hypothetical protein